MMIWFWLALGGAVFFAGFVVFVLARRSGPSSRRLPGLGRVGTPTALTIGISLMLSGYHLVAYLGPPGWITLAVRRDLWWLVFFGCVVAVIGTVIADRLLGVPSGTGGDGDSEPGDGGGRM